MKPLEFVGTVRGDLATFPEPARRRAGHELFMVQVGREPQDFKPLAIVGPGTYELRIRDASGAFRVVYVTKSGAAIYVLHAFKKKSQKTSRADIELAQERYKKIKDRL